MNEVRILSEIEDENIIELISSSIKGEYRKSDGRTTTVIYYIMKLA